MITSADVQVLRVALARSNGAHAHTAGKADFYLSRIADKPNARFSNCSADDFVAAVRAALYQDKWRELSGLMGRWW